MAYRNRNFDRNNYGGSISRNVDPWDTSNDNWGMRGGGGGGGGGGNNNLGGGGGGGGGGNYNQNPSNDLANHLLQLLRQNGGSQGPPSLMDLPQGGDMRGYGYGRNSGGGGGGDRFEDRRMGGGGGGGGPHNNNRQNQNNQNNNRNRRMGGNTGVGGVGPINGPRHHPQQQQQPPSMGHKGANQNSGGGNNLNRNSGGIRKPNSLDRSKKVLAKHSKNNNAKGASGDAAKTTPAKNKTTVAAADQSFADENEDGETGANAGESAYADVPSDMFYCHLCKKHMWDCTSFENHIKGRTHQMMKEGVEESYRMKANMIRQEAKIDEQLKSIEVDRLKRMGKQMKNSNSHREYCQMCDLHFYGHLSTHRKSEGHLTLKKFLHPRCLDCSEEFQNRIEFDNHLLSREHMLRCAAKASRVDPRRKNQLVILTEVDEAKDVREEKVKAAAAATAAPGEEGATPAVAAGTEDGAVAAAAPAENGEAAVAAEGEDKAGTTPAVEVENPDAIFDYIEGTTEVGADVETKLPTYNSTRSIARSMIAKLECFECKLCNRFFDQEKTADLHARTVYHHKQFTKFLTEKANEAKIAQKRAAATIENEKRKKARLEKEEAAAAGATPAENGTAAPAAEAPKTNGDAAAVVEVPVVAAVKVEVKKEEDNGEQPQKKAKVEMYDPCEATTDVDDLEKDVSMAEVPVTPVKAAAAPVVVTPAPPVIPATPAAAVKPAAAVTPAVATPATPAATPSPAATPKSAGSNPGTPGGRGRGGNRGNARGRGRGRRF